jgi:hypothetical protein
MADGKPRSIHEVVDEYRVRHAAFERRCWERWKPGFDLYDWMLLQTQNAAIFFIKHHRNEAVEQQDALYEAQTRLQARAYRTACEVRALLGSGNPDGALARWRTMHEILVVMRFLQKHGAETAERFLKYDLVQTAKNWGQYERLPVEWQILPVAPEEGEQARAERAKVVQAYEPSFENENGWAAHALGLTGAKSRVTFAQLEENVELERFRLYYNVAGNHIHVNMKGLADDVSVDLFPSMRGFSAAACTTLVGLAECTTIMVQLRPTPETEELERTLNQVVADASQTFLQIQQQMEQEERVPARPE